MSHKHFPRVGLVCPYGWQEATRMAFPVGDLLARLGIRVTWYPTTIELKDPDQESTHYIWDHHIIETAGSDFGAWTELLTHIVWFELLPQKMEAAKVAGKVNLWVPLVRQIGHITEATLGSVDRVLCPTQQCYDCLSAETSRSPKLRLLRWDSCLPLVPRPTRPVSPNQCRLLIELDAEGSVRFGPALYRVIGRLLERHPSLRVGLLRDTSFTPREESPAAKIQEKFAGRFSSIVRPCVIERMESAEDHDWVFLARQADNSGIAFLEYLAYGKPLWAFDVPPAHEICTDGQNCRFLPSRPAARNGNLPVASWKVDAVVEAADKLLQDDWRPFFDLAGREQPNLESRRRDYQQSWIEILEPHTN